ncbi:MAG: hypothetical protein J6C33_07785 [Lachnospiraceae bacterium]|nr:hypothetical protein [Lachnospiraceae bacterium]
MTNLLVLKEYLKGIYGKYEIYITPVVKFLLALITLMMINGKLGYMSRINSITVVLVAALLCSFLPMNFMILIAALFILLHLYAFSAECAIVVLALFMVMFLLYFRFSPKDGALVLLTPLCCTLNIPLAMPLSAGLVGTPASAVSVGCGVVIYSILQYISESVGTLNSMDAESAMQKYRYVVDGLLNNKTMLVMVFAFAVTVLVVYLIRRMSMNHSWTVAVMSGTLAAVAILLAGDLMFDTNISLVSTVIGAILSIAIVKLLQFFVFNVDYSRTEYVQFEDDEYYYYVKAVPKITVAKPSKTVKKITTQKKNAAPPRATGSVIKKTDKSGMKRV